ncbi:hypothetical protein CRENBAI_012309 [Crenichthys baileyi]|uniref:Uncharacterized protein n=1 Tax=Crenichthys baileyi TaxID=28760 RepID=A0AAV9RFU3_9TELE
MPACVPVSEEFESKLPPLPNPVPVPDPSLEGSEDELPPSLGPVPEEFVDELSPLPVSVSEGCGPFTDLHGSAADLHGLAKGPSGLCTARLGSSSFRTAPLSSTMGNINSVRVWETVSFFCLLLFLFSFRWRLSTVTGGVTASFSDPDTFSDKTPVDSILAPLTPGPSSEPCEPSTVLAINLHSVLLSYPPGIHSPPTKAVGFRIKIQPIRLSTPRPTSFPLWR